MSPLMPAMSNAKRGPGGHGPDAAARREFVPRCARRQAFACLVLIPYYLPGFRAGGPIQSLANLVSQLGTDVDFRILTSDRDLGEDTPYADIVAHDWNDVGAARVFYLPPSHQKPGSWARALRCIDYDVIYLNSLFSPRFTILPLMLRRLGVMPDVPVILAPRGELSPGALAIRRAKKTAYLQAARSLRLYDGVTWQASSSYEEQDIRTWFGSEARVAIAGNLAGQVGALSPPVAADPGADRSAPPRQPKAGGRARFAFLSRISPKKNLHVAVTMLGGLRGHVSLDIYGPVDDPAYWAKCQAAIAKAPPSLEVVYHGAVPHERVGEVLARSDFFFLPTMGENFGHVILDGLLAGLPLIISDRTPWRGLSARGVGWDLPLEQPERFHQVLTQCVEMEDATYRPMADRAWQFGRERAIEPATLEQNRRLFSASGMRRD